MFSFVLQFACIVDQVEYNYINTKNYLSIWKSKLYQLQTSYTIKKLYTLLHFQYIRIRIVRQLI